MDRGTDQIPVVEGAHSDKGEISLNIPDELPKFLTSTDRHILVFDDLERCSISVNDLLGYINHFVEHSGNQVILIANEQEILPKDSADPIYARIKEKLVGRTFRIEPDFEEALAAYFAKINEAEIRKAIETQAPTIKEVFDLAGYRNLRHLRHALLELERLLGTINPKYLKKPELVRHLTRIFMTVSFEVRSGSLKAADIGELLSYSYLSLSGVNPSPRAAKIGPLAAKYAKSQLAQALLPVALWREMFEKGVVDTAAIETALDASVYYLTDHSPPWRRLWYAFHQTDAEVKTLLEDVDKQFRAGHFQDIAELRHVTGTLMALADYGV